MEMIQMKCFCFALGSEYFSQKLINEIKEYLPSLLFSSMKTTAKL